jgi:hypothetical protein
MRITNKHNLPAALVRAIENDSYSRGESDITVTELIAPPQIVALKRKHREEMTEDAADLLYSLMGQAIHAILERAGTGMAEQRLYMTIDGVKIGGQIDHLENGELSDYKVMSVWESMNGLKPEKSAQLNILKLLCVENGLEVNSLSIVAIYRDWQRSKAGKDNYPPVQAQVFPIEDWGRERTIAYIRERLAAHKEVPECSEEDRWEKPPVYAVRTSGRKTAIRLLNSEEDARIFIDANGVKNGTIEHRPGERTRCEFYCPVSSFCNQHKEYLNARDFDAEIH